MTTRGIAYLVLALMIFAIQDAVVKLLTEKYEVIQILTWRILVVVTIIGSIAAYKHGLSFLKTQYKAFMLLRGAFAFIAFLNYYFALSFTPLADAATVYMTAPLFVTALSVPLLGERVGLHRWSAVVIGFTAVVIMLNPGSDLFQPIAMLPLVSALFYSFIPIITRRFGPQERTLTITFYTAVSYALLCVLLSVIVHAFPATSQESGLWRFVAQPWPSLTSNAWLLILLSSALFAAGIICITIAYRCADVSILAPFEYSYLLSAMIVGFIVFSDVPTMRTLLAACVIAGCGIYIAIRERHANNS